MRYTNGKENVNYHNGFYRVENMGYMRSAHDVGQFHILSTSGGLWRWGCKCPSKGSMHLLALVFILLLVDTEEPGIWEVRCVV